MTKHTMRWRAFTSRLFIHRPVLLWYAMRKAPKGSLAEDKRQAISSCRALASGLIRDIHATWAKPYPCQMSGWCATWQLYQATMVPLLSLFCDVDLIEIVQQSQVDVDLALSALSDLERWSPTAKRSFEVISRLNEASQAYSVRHRQLTLSQPVEARERDTERTPTLGTPSTHDSATMYDGFFVHDFLSELDWTNDQSRAFPNPVLEHSFLDYWDVGQEANRMI